MIDHLQGETGAIIHISSDDYFDYFDYFLAQPLEFQNILDARHINTFRLEDFSVEVIVHV